MKIDKNKKRRYYLRDYNSGVLCFLSPVSRQAPTRATESGSSYTLRLWLQTQTLATDSDSSSASGEAHNPQRCRLVDRLWPKDDGVDRIDE
jgi:hypothetical protein